MEFRVWGVGLRVWGLEFRVFLSKVINFQDLGFGGLGLRELWVKDAGTGSDGSFNKATLLQQDRSCSSCSNSTSRISRKCAQVETKAKSRKRLWST